MGGGGSPLELMLTGQLPAIMLVAVPAAFLVTLVLLWTYLTAVKRSMRRGAPSPADRWSAPPTSSMPPPAQPLTVSHVGRQSDVDTRTTTHDFPAARGPWQAAAIYAVAGIAFALVMAAIYLSANAIDFLPVRFSFVLLLYVWPTVVLVGLVAAESWRDWVLVVAIYLAAAVGIIALAIGTSFTVLSAAQAWLIFNGLATLMVVLALARPIRAVGPLVLALMVVAAAGAMVSVNIIAAEQARLRWAANWGLALGLDAGGTLVALHAIAMLVLGAASLMLLRVFGRLYQAQWISDQSIMTDAVMIVFAVAYGIDLTYAGPAWFLAPFAAWLLFKLVVRLGFALTRRGVSSAEAPLQLLLLRVFPLGRRSQQLFDRVMRQWRHVGRTWMIAGPDLATTTVEPHEVLDFMGGRLDRRFIDGSEALTRRLGESYGARDTDGRYRVNSFFCHDHTWQAVLIRLARDSDVVLMDLRGFASDDDGCVFKMHALLDHVALTRMLFVIDDTTDLGVLEQTLHAGWAALAEASPNRSESTPVVRLFSLSADAGGGVRELLGQLAQAAVNNQTFEGAR